jgi:hypothetical protein
MSRLGALRALLGRPAADARGIGAHRVRFLSYLVTFALDALVHRRIRLIPLSLPGLTRKSIPKGRGRLESDARIILGFQTGHGAPNGNPRTGHDKQVYAPFASVH